MKKTLIVLLAFAVLQWTVVAYADTYTDYIKGVRADMRQRTDEEVIQRINFYNGLAVETRGDEIAKYIVFDEWMKVAKERKSNKAIKDSGVLNLEYEKIDIKKMNDQTLADLFKYYMEKLAPYAGANAMPEAKFKQQPEIVQRMYGMRLVTATMLAKEGSARNSNKNFWAGLGQGLGAVAAIADKTAEQRRQNAPQTQVVYIQQDPTQQYLESSRRHSEEMSKIMQRPLNLPKTTTATTTVDRDLYGNVTGWDTQER